MFTKHQSLCFVAGLVCLFSYELSDADIKPWMCGPYTLCQVIERYGMVISPERVAKLARTTESGTTMKGLADAAYQLGLKAAGQKTSYPNFVQLKPPFIALIRLPEDPIGNHFIVVDRVKPDQLEVWDVNQGYSILSREAFEHQWDGYVLTVAPRPPHQDGRDAACLSIDEPTYDFGTIAEMEKAEHTFVIRNIGQKPLEILKVAPSCTCEEATLKDTMIPPGGFTTLHVLYRGSTRSGKTRAAVYLSTNDPNQPEAVVSMFGFISGVVGVSPGHFYLGEMDPKASIQRSFVIQRPQFGKVKILSVTSSAPWLKTRVESLNEREIIARVHFGVPQGLPLGPVHEIITVHTDAMNYPDVRVLVEGVVIGDIRFQPNQFFMGILQADIPVRRTVVLENRGKADLKILKIENDLPTIQAKAISVEPGKKYEIEAICTPSAPSGSSSGTIRDRIRIHTNNVQQPVLEIPLYALIQ